MTSYHGWTHLPKEQGGTDPLILSGKFEGLVFSSVQPLVTGDNANGWFMVVPEDLNNYYLGHAEAGVYTPSSGSDVEVVVRNVTQATDMAEIVINTGDNTSYAAGGSSTIAGGQVATGDVLVVDVDVAGTGTFGLVVILHFVWQS